MKCDARRIAQVVRSIDAIRVACLYGDDDEVIRDCARRLVVAAAGSADDPFRVTECDGEQREAIDAALASPGLSGGRSVVWVRHATERLLPTATDALARRTGALLVLEYGGSAGRSRLRAQVDQSEHGCVVSCYAQADATGEAIRAVLATWEVTAPEEAIGLLSARAEATQCPGQRAGLAAALYAGRGGRLDVEDAYEIAGGSGRTLGLTAGLSEGLCGDAAALDASVAAAIAEDGGIAVLRVALVHLQRLRALGLQVADGRTVAEAGRALRPPLFFREEKSAASALRAWSAEQLAAAARSIWEAERASKAAGAPQEAVCREILAGLPRRAESRKVVRRG